MCNYVGKWAIALSWWLTATAYAGGGMVGNGGGLVEQNAAFAYRALPRAISQCLQMPACMLTGREALVLRKIQETVIGEIKKGGKKLEYISANERPGFFDTDINQFHRLSRTNLDTLGPIYFNEDQLYTEAGLPAVDTLTLSGMLVHEFGHQAGFTDHEELNAIGAKVRFLLSAQIMTVPYTGESLTVSVINYAVTGIPLDVQLTAGSRVTSLAYLIIGGAKCRDSAQRAIGWKLTNAHWERAWSSNQSGVSATVYPFEAWLQLDCVDDKGSLSTQLQDIELQVQLGSVTEHAPVTYLGTKSLFRDLH